MMKLILYLLTVNELLALKNSTWINCMIADFFFPIGAYDSTQVAELFCLYTFEIIIIIVDPKLVGLYRDDGLICVPNSNGRLTVKLQYKILDLVSYWSLR